MSKNNHPIEQEELMAYLDGELATERAVAAAAHLERCTECQQLAADLKNVSQKLLAWEVEASDSKITPGIAAPLEECEKQPPRAAASDRRDWGMLFSARRLVWAGGLAVAALAVVMVSTPTLLRSRRAAQEAGKTVTYTYDVAGNIKASNGAAPAENTPQDETYTSTYTYDATNKLSTPHLPKVAILPSGSGHNSGATTIAGKNGYIDQAALTSLPPQARRSAGLVAVDKLQAIEEQDG